MRVEHDQDRHGHAHGGGRVRRHREHHDHDQHPHRDRPRLRRHAAAIALLSRKGFSALDASTYRPDDTLRVLIGRAAAGERAFFFDDTTYLGTDAAAASARITVSAHSDTEVVLSYAIYRPGAAAPSGVRLVHFALDMGILNALDPIPSVSQRR